MKNVLSRGVTFTRTPSAASSAATIGPTAATTMRSKPCRSYASRPKERATSRNRRTWGALVKAIASICPAAISAMTAARDPAMNSRLRVFNNDMARCRSVDGPTPINSTRRRPLRGICGEAVSGQPAACRLIPSPPIAGAQVGRDKPGDRRCKQETQHHNHRMPIPA